MEVDTMKTENVVVATEDESYYAVITFADFVSSIIDDHAQAFSNLSVLRKRGDPLFTKDFFEFIDTLLWAEDISQVEATLGLQNNAWVHSYFYHKLQQGYVHTLFGKVAVH
jgi:hypothetical protein